MWINSVEYTYFSVFYPISVFSDINILNILEYIKIYIQVYFDKLVKHSFNIFLGVVFQY